MTELKKCPFCGGEAEYNKETEFNTHGDMYTSHYVWCPYPKNGCGARIYGHSKQEAIEAWNNRTTEVEIRALAIEEFAEKLKWELRDSIIPDEQKFQYERKTQERICVQNAAFKVIIKLIEKLAEQLKEESECI